MGFSFIHPESVTGAIWGAYSSLGSKASEEIFLWQSDGTFSYSSHFSSLDLGH